MGLKRYEDYSKAVRHALNAEKNWADISQEVNHNFKRPQPQTGGNLGNSGGWNSGGQKKQRWDNRGPSQGPTYNQNLGQFQGPNQAPRNFVGQGSQQRNVQGPDHRPVCPKCGKKHFGACMTGNCFNCGNGGHFAKDCHKPPRNQNPPNQMPGTTKKDEPKKRVAGRVFAMTGEEV